MGNCDCLIGFLCGDEVKLSELELRVNDILRYREVLKKYGFLDNRPSTAKRIVDGRSHELYRFAYCPYCGVKINWTAILRKFR